MKVFVKSKRNEKLMPCSNRKARLLLKQNKAKIVKYNPFTIQLTIPTGETVQECVIGIDTGSKHVGFAIVSNNKVLCKGEVELRQDVSSLLQTRKIYRTSRRYRKTRYRKARWLNRKKDSNWLPPSIQSRINATFKWIDTFVNLVPNCKLHIEVGKFDIAKMINPEISGEEYQQGQTYGYYNTRYFVFARDNYTCQVCKKKNGILRTHHIVYKSKGGTDRADNLITVCTDCHTSENHEKDGIFYKWMKEHKKVKQYKEPTFMSIIRKRIFSKYPEALITYGNEAVVKRKELNLEKTHFNDAIAITKINEIKENCDDVFLIKQFRNKKRSLHEATARKGRKEPNRTQKRSVKNVKKYKGFCLGDIVEVFGKKGFITGFTNNACYVKNYKNEYITTPNKKYNQVQLSQVKLLYRNNGWQYYPHLKERDFLC